MIQLVILMLALVFGFLSAVFSILGFICELRRRINPEAYWRLTAIFGSIFAILAFTHHTDYVTKYVIE